MITDAYDKLLYTRHWNSLNNNDNWHVHQLEETPKFPNRRHLHKLIITDIFHLDFRELFSHPSMESFKF